MLSLHFVAHSPQKVFLSHIESRGADSSLMVFSAPSEALRCSGESPEGSGVVPDEDAIPPWETDDTDGDAAMEVDEVLFLFDAGLEAVGLPILPILDELVMNGVDLSTAGNI